MKQKQFKAAFVLGVLLLFVFALIGCGDNAPVEGNASDPDSYADETYYTVGLHINLPYWQDHKKGLEAAAAELGVKAVFTGETGNDAVNQLNIFEQIVAKNPAGILVAPVDSEAMTPAIDRAIEAGIPVITINVDAPNSKRYTYLGTPEYDAGWQAADVMSEALDKKGKIGVLTIIGVESVDERTKGFQECIEQNYPQMEIVSIQTDEGDVSKAASVAAHMLQSHPELDGLFGADAAAGPGAATAFREAGVLGEVIIVAFDKDDVVLDLVEEGSIYATMVQRTFAMSYYGCKLLFDYNRGSIKFAKDIEGLDPLPDYVNTGIVVVTKDNVHQFK